MQEEGVADCCFFAFSAAWGTETLTQVVFLREMCIDYYSCIWGTGRLARYITCSTKPCWHHHSLGRIYTSAHDVGVTHTARQMITRVARVFAANVLGHYSFDNCSKWELGSSQEPDLHSSSHWHLAEQPFILPCLSWFSTCARSSPREKKTMSFHSGGLTKGTNWWETGLKPVKVNDDQTWQSTPDRERVSIFQKALFVFLSLLSRLPPKNWRENVELPSWLRVTIQIPMQRESMKIDE